MVQGAAKKVTKKKKSVLKRIRQTLRRTEVNRANRSSVRTALKRMHAALRSGDLAAAGSLLSPTHSAIDRAIRQGALPENTANRYKSRLTLEYNSLKAARKS